jgi:transposase
MTRPYSMDLRERALARVQAGESVRVVARALSISPSSVVKWSQRFRATGSTAAGKMGGHRGLLVGEHAAFLRDRGRRSQAWEEAKPKRISNIQAKFRQSWRRRRRASPNTAIPFSSRKPD